MAYDDDAERRSDAYDESLLPTLDFRILRALVAAPNGQASLSHLRLTLGVPMVELRARLDHLQQAGLVVLRHDPDARMLTYGITVAGNVRVRVEWSDHGDAESAPR